MSDVIAVQQAALDRLYATHVAAGDAYALLDFPDHANVGDSAIWLGEIAMLQRLTGREPTYVCRWHDFDAAALRAACPDGVVFLHGGGNLGDIWPHHQALRETVLRDLYDRQVVQLPQSIRFRDPAGVAPFAALGAAHPAFVLYVRDADSLAFAEARLDCAAMLAPDSAFALGRQVRGDAAHDCVMLMRTDDERIVHDVAPEADAIVVDWLADGPLPEREAGETLAAHWERIAAARVARGLALLSGGRRVVTDRLHGHILALLLDLPHVAFDNDYGKVGAYIETWTRASPLVRRG